MQEEQHEWINLSCVSRYIGHIPGRTCRVRPHAVKVHSGDRKRKKVIERETICTDFSSSECIVHTRILFAVTGACPLLQKRANEVPHKMSS